MIINKSLIRGDFSLLVTQSLSNNANLPSVLIAPRLLLFLAPPPLLSWKIFPIIQFLLNYLPPTLIHHLSHHLNICPITLLLQLFLNCDLPGNTVQKSTSHKCGHKSRYNAFNVVVTAFLQIFWSLPFSLCVREASLRGGNFVENYYNGLSK